MSDRTKQRALAEIKLDSFNFPVLQSFPRDVPSGIFAVGETGRVSFDLLFEKNRAGGDLGWFSLRDIELREIDSQEFIREIVRRTKSNSDLGGSILRDRISPISGNGEQILQMNPGETFALAFFPEGIESGAHPILSLSSRRFADAGNGRIVAMELAESNAIDALTGQLERPYTDSIFQVKGATAQLEKLDALVTREQDWRETSFGREILATCSNISIFTYF
ncbi:MAG: hypothetical protein AB4290_31310 [Spirulina sp.]